MKKISFVLVVSLLILSLAGCGGGATDSSVPDNTGNNSIELSSIEPAVDTSTDSTKPDSSDVSQAEISSSDTVQSSKPSSSSEVPKTSSADSTQVSTPGSNTSGNNDTIPYITKDLVARYDFEDAANIGKDVSGNNNDLFVWSNTGGTVGQVKNKFNDKLGNAASFNGNALLAAKTPDDSQTPSKDFLDSINGSYTITFFAKNSFTEATSTEEHCNLICNGYWNNPTTPNLELAFTYQKDGAWDAFASYLNFGGVMNDLIFRKFVWQADNSNVYQYGKIDTSWYHYALIVNTEKVCVDLYIDGKLVKSNSPGTQGLATQSEEVPFSIGGMAVPMENVPVRDLLIGEMDDVRVYSRVLSVYEIKNIQNFKG